MEVNVCGISRFEKRLALFSLIIFLNSIVAYNFRPFEKFIEIDQKIMNTFEYASSDHFQSINIELLL